MKKRNWFKFFVIAGWIGLFELGSLDPDGTRLLLAVAPVVGAAANNQPTALRLRGSDSYLPKTNLPKGMRDSRPAKPSLTETASRDSLWKNWGQEQQGEFFGNGPDGKVWKYPEAPDGYSWAESNPPQLLKSPFGLLEAIEPVPMSPIAPTPSPEPVAPSPIPAPPVAVAPESTQKPEVKIRVPTSVDYGTPVHIEFEYSGGPVRVDANGKPEVEITIEPEPVIKFEVDPKLLKDPDKHRIFVAEPGIYTVKVWATGVYSHFRTEVRFQVKAPFVPEKQAEAPTGGAADLRQWVSQVNSRNRGAEVAEIAAAGRIAAKAKRDGRIAPTKSVMDEWQEQARLKLGTALLPWVNNAAGQPFFDKVAELYQQNENLKGSDSANFVDNICTILEGK